MLMAPPGGGSLGQANGAPVGQEGRLELKVFMPGRPYQEEKVDGPTSIEHLVMLVGTAMNIPLKSHAKLRILC